MSHGRRMLSPGRGAAAAFAVLLACAGCGVGGNDTGQATVTVTQQTTVAASPRVVATVPGLPTTTPTASVTPTTTAASIPRAPTSTAIASTASTVTRSTASSSRLSTPSPVPRPAAIAVTPAPTKLVSAPKGPMANPTCPGVRCVTIALTGDVLLHPELVAQAREDATDGAAMDFEPMLAGQNPYIQGADIGICHLETPLAPAEGPFKGYPVFSVPPQVLPALVTSGYDACSTASNHTLDQGTEGIQRTLDDLDAVGLLHDGSYRTEAESKKPVIINTGHGRVGFISMAYDWNGFTLEHPWQARLIDVKAVKARAKLDRAAGADLVIVAMHAGEEYQTDPTDQQTETAKALLADPNIDLVYGHHAHVVQPMQKINGKWAIYGLGNNIAAQGTEITGTRDGLLVRIQFSQDKTGRWTTSNLAWVASYQDLYSPYRWCALTDGQTCGPDDQASIDRTTTAVNLLGADRDGARRLH